MNEVANASDDSRRSKLEKIIELGIDPWGQRFDDRDMIGDIRNRESEIKFVTEDGEELDLPGDGELGRGGGRDDGGAVLRIPVRGSAVPLPQAAQTGRVTIRSFLATPHRILGPKQ